MDIKCLGWLRAFFGEKVFIYKLTIDNVLYKIADLNMAYMPMSVWDGENFSNTSFTDEEKEAIKQEVLKLEKVDVELTKSGEDGELFTEERNYFPRIKKEVVPVINTSKTHEGIFTDDEVTHLLDVICDEFDCRNEDEQYKIDDEMIDFAKERFELDLSFLKDFTFEHSVDGFHKTDGQMVEYVFFFTSPNGVETNFSTEMCLMIGWNVCEGITFGK